MGGMGLFADQVGNVIVVFEGISLQSSKYSVVVDQKEWVEKKLWIEPTDDKETCDKKQKQQLDIAEARLKEKMNSGKA